MKSRPTKITPKMAAKMLTHNKSNRPLSQITVDRYAAAMESGEWQLNGDTVRFDEQGNLIDGQHRLHACIKANKAFRAYIVTGLPPEAFDTIDQGRPRTMADVLARRGEKNYALLASAVRNLWQITLGYGQKGKMRPSIMDAILDEHPQLREAVHEASAAVGYRGKGIIPPSYVASLWYLFGREKPQKNRDFWERVIEGTDLKKDMPEYWLRKRLLDNMTAQAKLPEQAVFALCIKAWNASSHNKPMKSLRWADNEGFPAIQGSDFVDTIKLPKIA